MLLQTFNCININIFIFLAKCINNYFENLFLFKHYILETNIFKNKSFDGKEIDISINILKKASGKGNSTADLFLGLFYFMTKKQSLYYF